MAHRLPCRTPLTIAVGSLLAVGHAQAAVITVNTTADGPPGSMPGTCSLRSAIYSANEAYGYDACASGSAGADEIAFDPDLAGSYIALTEGEIEISSGLTITGPAPGAFGVLIGGSNASRIFNVQGGGSGGFEVILDSLAMLNGRTSQNNEPGGAVYVDSADIRLSHSLISGSATEGEYSPGGGLYVVEGDATLTNSMVLANATEELRSKGGGMHVDNGDATLTSSMVSGNSTAGSNAYGGGLSVLSGDATLNESTVSGNSTMGPSAHGGGLRFGFSNSTLTNSTMSGNSTAGELAHGGGVAVVAGGTELSNSTVSGNSTAGDDAYGGGLHAYDVDTTLTNSTISGNSTEGGGAHGGGLYVRGSFVTERNATLIQTTVAYNIATDGTDDVHRGDFATLTLSNSLIVQAGTGEESCNATADVHDNSLATDDSCTGAATVLSEIALDPLADNGGHTFTHALGAASAARDAAGDCYATFEIDTDQRGQPRPGVGSDECDIGAFEYQVLDELFQDRFESP